jgi:acyl-lipid omega-6 desaturase (Delta-12 desaturase)
MPSLSPAFRLLVKTHDAESLTRTGIPSLDEIRRSWKQAVAAYQHPETRRSVIQLANSVGPFLALLAVAYLLAPVSPWIPIALAPFTAGFMVRVFIIFHDCGHGSFFRSRRANDVVGSITGVLTFTPYFDWRAEHNRHHATAGDLDRRGVGDVFTMTVEEYRRAPWLRRLGYRLYRNPLVMLGIGPLFVFLLKQRVPHRGAARRERASVHLTNLALIVLFGALVAIAGLPTVLLVQLPVLALAGAAGVALFYVQHQFEHVYWARKGARDYVAVAVEGSSMLELPRILQWFSGNIGFHHIHHLSPRIPNYRLETCFKEQPLLQHPPRLTLGEAIRTFRFRLYDEASGRMVSFREANQTAPA